MYQAIVTKYIGPSDLRGSRIKARSASKSITIPLSHTLSYTDAHIDAARQLAAKMEWKGEWVGGGNPSEDGFTFVLVTGEGFSI